MLPPITQSPRVCRLSFVHDLGELCDFWICYCHGKLVECIVNALSYASVLPQ
jgi:hypothetical protein